MTQGNKETKSSTSFFSNREIWEQVFGIDGRGGVIKELDDKVEEKFSSLRQLVCEEFKTLSNKIDEYNGLREAVESHEGKMDKHILFCQERVRTMNEKEYKKDTHDSSFKEGKKEAFREVRSFIAIITASLAVIGTIIGLLGYFVF